MKTITKKILLKCFMGWRPLRVAAALLILAVNVGATLPALAAAWTLDLTERATVSGGVARLADLASAPVPTAAGELTVLSGERPGVERVVTRRAVLRHLVLAGLADGVRLTGAEACRVRFTGAVIDSADLAMRLRRELAPLLPPATFDGPPTWLEIEMPGHRATADGDWRVTVNRDERLAPGRNLVPVVITAGRRRQHLTALITVHAFGRTATAAGPLPAGTAVTPESFAWEWRDLGTMTGDLVLGPEELAGSVTSRDLRPGQPLRREDLAPRPVVRRDELVDLVSRRGGVEVRVRARSRQDGIVGQVISVRNLLTGQLITGRVAGPGLVALGR